MKRKPGRGQPDAVGVETTRAKLWGVIVGVPFMFIGLLIGFKLRLRPVEIVGCMIATGLIAGMVVRYVSMALAGIAGSAVLSALQPSGASTPYQHQYSYQESLAAKGDIAGAIESYEALIAEWSDDFEARVRVADLYARSAKQPEKAAEHFRAVQRTPDVTPERLIYASNRLVDLYLGPLDDDGHAMIELRKIIDWAPNSAVGQNARLALSNLKKKKLLAES